MTIEEQDFLIKATKKGFDIISQKRADYTGSSDVLGLFKASSEAVGITPEQAIGYEIEKKKRRILSLIKNKKTNPLASRNFESIYDNMIDIMNYHFILSCLSLEDFCKKSGLDPRRECESIESIGP